MKSQAYGRREELAGIHVAAAALIAAYADARAAGHPVIALIVGRCVSGAFLALAGQANRLIAFDDPEVLIHAMYKEAAARITRRTVAELDRLGEEIVPMAYDIGSFAKLGALYALLNVASPDTPTKATVEQVEKALVAAIARSPPFAGRSTSGSNRRAPRPSAGHPSPSARKMEERGPKDEVKLRTIDCRSLAGGSRRLFT